MNTSCTVPVPVYKHFKPASVWYCTLKLGGVLPLRTLIRPGTMRVTCGHSLMIRLRISSSPPTRPCWRLMRPNFIRRIIEDAASIAPAHRCVAQWRDGEIRDAEYCLGADRAEADLAGGGDRAGQGLRIDERGATAAVDIDRAAWA